MICCYKYDEDPLSHKIKHNMIMKETCQSQPRLYHIILKEIIELSLKGQQ